MTNHYELTKKEHKKEPILKCIYCPTYFINGEWFKDERKEPYENIKDSVCPSHYVMYQSDLEKDIEKVFNQMHHKR